MSWLTKWFTGGKGNAKTMNLEEAEDKLVYDEKTQRWVKESELKSGTVTPQQGQSPMPPASPLPPVSPQPTEGVTQPQNVTGRRPRYIDPFTQEVHQTVAPVIESAQAPTVPPTQN